MRLLPVFLALASAKVVLIGAGAPAVNKLRLLRAAGANVRWYAISADAAEAITVRFLPAYEAGPR